MALRGAAKFESAWILRVSRCAEKVLLLRGALLAARTEEPVLSIWLIAWLSSSVSLQEEKKNPIYFLFHSNSIFPTCTNVLHPPRNNNLKQPKCQEASAEPNFWQQLSAWMLQTRSESPVWYSSISSGRALCLVWDMNGLLLGGHNSEWYYLERCGFKS